MKKITLLAAALFCVAANAHAVNLTGTWSGTGTAVDSNGKSIECSAVALTIQHTASSLAVSSAFTCDGNQITIPGATMEIRGAELFDKGVKAGNISANSLTVTAKAKGYVMQSTASFTESTMNLKSVVSVGNNPPALTFGASLKR